MKKIISLLCCISKISLNINLTVVLVTSNNQEYLLKSNYEQIKEIDLKLDQMGVKDISSSEVIENNSQIKNRPQPYTSIPLGITNLSFRITGWITYTNPNNGKKYQVQTLFATPNNKSSCLKSKGNYVANKSNFTAFTAQVEISTVVGALHATTSFINNHGNSPQTLKSAWLQVLSNSKSIGFYIPANPASRY